MNFQEVKLEELHRASSGNSDDVHTTIEMVNRILRLIDQLRNEHGEDSVRVKGTFYKLSKKVDEFYPMFGVGLVVEVDTDRITIYDTEVPA